MFWRMPKAKTTVMVVVGILDSIVEIAFVIQ
jgi:hypothetical protein